MERRNCGLQGDFAHQAQALAAAQAKLRTEKARMGGEIKNRGTASAETVHAYEDALIEVQGLETAAKTDLCPGDVSDALRRRYPAVEKPVEIMPGIVMGDMKFT